MANSTPAAHSIKVVTALFAALVGIGLTQLLDIKESKLRQDHQWWPFTVALLLSLRLMTGSANHLWHDHVNKIPKLAGDKPEVNKTKLIFDLGLLATFGCVIAVMCYLDDAGDFLLLGAGLMLGAAMWDAVDWWLFKNSAWWFWLPLDILHGAVFLSVYRFQQLWWSWWLVFLASLVFLIIDFWCQLTVMTEGSVPKPNIDGTVAAMKRVGRWVLVGLVVVSAAFVGVLAGRWVSILLQRAMPTGWTEYRLWWIPVRVGLIVASLFLVLGVGRVRDAILGMWSYLHGGHWNGWSRTLTARTAFLSLVVGLLFAPLLPPTLKPTPPAGDRLIVKTSIASDKPIAVVPILFELATADGKRGTTLTEHHQSEVLRLLNGFTACLEGPQPATIVLKVRGFADDNPVRKFQDNQSQEKANLNIAKMRHDNLLNFIDEHTAESRNPRSNGSPKLIVESQEPQNWGSDKDMKNARAFWIRPIAETLEAEHHLNRRADIVIQDAGGCDSWRSAR